MGLCNEIGGREGVDASEVELGPDAYVDYLGDTGDKDLPIEDLHMGDAMRCL